jgi:RNA-directed DNA polymerase
LGNLSTPTSVQKLQCALQSRAKEAADYRFYSLYDKVYREDLLRYAYRCCRTNRGAAGVDGVGFEDIGAYGAKRWLAELAQRLKHKEYRPQAIKRVYIPKPNGTLRPLGIPTIRDRVVQTAATLILESIFEVDLPPEQYAYRADRNAWQAINRVHRLLNDGHHEVIDADLSDYFGSIPHAELLACVARRVVDRQMLHLIKMWLTAPVEEIGTAERKKRIATGRASNRGIPQGAPLSPLLSNLYMRRFVLGWKRLGYERRWQAQIVNYADDLVICCRGSAEEALHAMRQMMQRLKLAMNEEKTRRCGIPGEDFDFLGYTFGRCYSGRTGKAYLGTRPSKKSVHRLMQAISETTSRRTLLMDAEAVVEQINRMVQGWTRYFCLGSVSRAYRAIDEHAPRRLCRWLCMKHKRGRLVRRDYPDAYLHETLGLLSTQIIMQSLPWAQPSMSGPRAGCGRSARPVR